MLSKAGMNVSLYQAAAAMNANTRWQEVIAENLAASSIPGARKQEVSFSAVQAGLTPGLTAQSNGNYVMPAATTSMNFQPGLLKPTGVSTDVAIEGPGFLEVQLPDGTHAYTRDGELHLNAQAQLVTKQGYRVIGEGGPLQMDPSNTAAMTISPTGELTQSGEVKGTIRLVDFSQPNLLRGIGDGYFVTDSSQKASAASGARLRQGYLEGANISPTQEMASLLTAMRMFEANQKVMTMQDDRMGRAISDLGNPS